MATIVNCEEQQPNVSVIAPLKAKLLMWQILNVNDNNVNDSLYKGMYFKVSYEFLL